MQNSPTEHSVGLFFQKFGLRSPHKTGLPGSHYEWMKRPVGGMET
jgi:hypothetical protein